MMGRILHKKGTRDAVETAIGLAKGDKDSTWEKGVSKQPKEITHWNPKEGLIRQEVFGVQEKVPHSIQLRMHKTDK